MLCARYTSPDRDVYSDAYWTPLLLACGISESAYSFRSFGQPVLWTRRSASPEAV